MKKYITSYELTGKEQWPDEVKKKFAQQMSKFGCAYFYEGSEIEIEFLNACSRFKIKPERCTFLKCTGKDLYEYPFHYLCVPAPVNELVICEDAMDFSSSCNKCSSGATRIGATQVKKLTANTSKLKKYDIVEPCVQRRPNIIIISRQLKELMVPFNFTGYRLVPCLEYGINYSEEQKDFLLINPELEEKASYFQLIVTEKVNNPPYGGFVTNFMAPCKNCNTFPGFFLSITPYFHKKDLKNVDFQYYNEYNSENFSPFFIPNNIPIISGKVLKFFIENKIKLSRCMTDPPLKYEVVEIRENETK